MLPWCSSPSQQFVFFWHPNSNPNHTPKIPNATTSKHQALNTKPSHSVGGSGYRLYFVAYRAMAEQQRASALYDSRIIKFMDFALSEVQPMNNVYTGKRAGGNGSLWSVAWDDGPIVTPTAESMGPRFVHRVYRIWFRPSTAAHKAATGVS